MPRYNLEVGDVKTISDGNGGTLQAKLLEVGRYRVRYRARKGNRGPFRMETECSRRAFTDKLQASA